MYRRRCPIPAIRCKKCGETIAVKAPAKAARPKVRVTADDEDDDAPRRPARRNREDDDDDYDDAPRKKKSKGGVSPILIGGLDTVAATLGMNVLACLRPAQPRRPVVVSRLARSMPRQ